MCRKCYNCSTHEQHGTTHHHTSPHSTTHHHTSPHVIVCHLMVHPSTSLALAALANTLFLPTSHSLSSSHSMLSTSHVTRHTSHITRHTSHITQHQILHRNNKSRDLHAHTSTQAASNSGGDGGIVDTGSFAANDGGARHMSHVTRNRGTRHTSHATRNRGTSHTSHITRHTSHITHHTSHITHHTHTCKY